MKKKAIEDLKKEKLRKEKDEQEKLEREQKQKKGEEAFLKWLEIAKSRPQTAQSSYGYTSGKLTGELF